MENNECLQCLDKLVQWHNANEHNEKLEKDITKLKKKIRRLKKQLQTAKDLIDSQDAILTLLLNR